MTPVLTDFDVDYGTFIVSIGILLVNLVFYAKKWKTGVGKE
tara:strand:+ start:29339 stop:29461 length:123 start_codon:yes stop_codon:yes gene_type:complete